MSDKDKNQEALEKQLKDLQAKPVNEKIKKSIAEKLNAINKPINK